MNIELLKTGKFSNSGSAVLRLMQNNSTPTIDLIVRESVQNSLDAVLPGGSKVFVRFFRGDFNVDEFSSHFIDIKDEIVERFGNKKAYFLSIMDRGTQGLTGNLNGIFEQGEKNQNLGKLVFQIMKPQDNECAGGSWGIGKTVYFRAGIGMVIYYSRIKLDNGTFQERLAAALVEDETTHAGILSKFKNNLGVAFFGEQTSEGIIAISNKDEIHKFLSIFNMMPYSGNDTGTNIIIPFIDEEALLKNNVDEEKKKKWWQNSLYDYLKVSLLRWYFPRMCENYNYGAKLVAIVNDEIIKHDVETPLFNKYMELYNAVFSTVHSDKISKSPITRQSNVKFNELGTFVYTTLSKDELKMNKEHLPNPYEYTLLDHDNDDFNSPLIAFCRRPGMIVNYTNEGRCIADIKNPENTYIIGLFVLNSTNEIISPKNLNLDEYIRKSEKSDHTSWVDHPIDKAGTKIQIVQMINNQIAKILSKNFGKQDNVSGDSSIDMRFASLFGKLLLPEENFGNGGSGTNKVPKKNGGRGGAGIVKNLKGNKIIFDSQEFKKDKIFLNYIVNLTKGIKEIRVNNVINTINGGVDPVEWITSGLDYPCNINAVAIKFDKCANKKNIGQTRIVNSNIEPYKHDGIECEFLILDNKCYGFSLKLIENLFPCSFILKISISTTNKLIQTDLNISIKEEK